MAVRTAGLEVQVVRQAEQDSGDDHQRDLGGAMDLFGEFARDQRRQNENESHTTEVKRSLRVMDLIPPPKRHDGEWKNDHGDQDMKIAM